MTPSIASPKAAETPQDSRRGHLNRRPQSPFARREDNGRQRSLESPRNSGERANVPFGSIPANWPAAAIGILAIAAVYPCTLMVSAYSSLAKRRKRGCALIPWSRKVSESSHLCSARKAGNKNKIGSLRSLAHRKRIRKVWLQTRR